MDEMPVLPDETHEHLLGLRLWCKANLPKGHPFRAEISRLVRKSQKARKAAR
jgi:hypothetical protein